MGYRKKDGAGLRGRLPFRSPGRHCRTTTDNRPTDCEMMARVADFVARDATTPHQFISDFSRAVAGVHNISTLRSGGGDRLPSGSRGGFQERYGGDSGSQPRHFAGAVYGAYVLQGFGPLFRNRSYDRERGDPMGREDHELSKAAYAFVWHLTPTFTANGYIPPTIQPANAGAWMRENICQ